MSEMLEILIPSAFSARTDDSRPGPGPLMRTSSVLIPYSSATRPADSAATWAANGVDLREPLKPAPPDVAHDKALPRSEEHTSELQSLMRISYAVFCLKKKNTLI